jgi:hypothetical protein
MQLLVICNYIQIFLQLFLVLVIFAIVVQLLWCSSFHVNNILFNFHAIRIIYVPLAANVTNLVITNEYTKVYFVNFKEYTSVY